MCHTSFLPNPTRTSQPEKARITQNARASARCIDFILFRSFLPESRHTLLTRPYGVSCAGYCLYANFTYPFYTGKTAYQSREFSEPPTAGYPPDSVISPSRRRKPKNRPRNARLPRYFAMAAFTLLRFSRVSASSGSMLSAASNCSTASGNRPSAA